MKFVGDGLYGKRVERLREIEGDKGERVGDFREGEGGDMAEG